MVLPVNPKLANPKQAFLPRVSGSRKHPAGVLRADTVFVQVIAAV
jgi:hypothetical protein